MTFVTLYRGNDLYRIYSANALVRANVTHKQDQRVEGFTLS